MANDKPLMPKATAVWLVDNTSLTFEQVADFCGLHPLEVKGIADEDVAKGIKGQDPVAAGQTTREEIEKAEADPEYRMKMATPKYKLPHVKLKKSPRYTPVSKRQDKPDAIYWLLRNHPELTDPDIVRMVGTTKATITKIRERHHWNSQNIKAVDPVTLGLCTQLELDFAVAKAAKRRAKATQTATKRGAGMKPIEETTAGLETGAVPPAPAEAEPAPASPPEEAPAEKVAEPTIASVFPESGETKED